MKGKNKTEETDCGRDFLPQSCWQIRKCVTEICRMGNPDVIRGDTRSKIRGEPSSWEDMEDFVRYTYREIGGATRRFEKDVERVGGDTKRSGM
jgi:hypothetical protein